MAKVVVVTMTEQGLMMTANGSAGSDNNVAVDSGYKIVIKIIYLLFTSISARKFFRKWLLLLINLINITDTF